MFPNTYFGLFPPFPRENKVFVAMSFDERFQSRWENVIAPAIRRVTVNNVPFEPHRVDTRTISDSILTEILDGVTNDRLIFADLTTLSYVGDNAIRNGNVMYEIGLAHAVRLAEEVIIFRSDSDSLLFDLAHIRVNSYEPDTSPEHASDKVTAALVDALKEIDSKRHLSTKSAAQSLDYTSLLLLATAIAEGGIQHFSTRTMGEALGNSAKNAAIARLLELRALKTIYNPEGLVENEDRLGEGLLKYVPTSFGRAIAEYNAEEMLRNSPKAQAILADMVAKKKMHSRVARGFSPPAPTPPGMRVRTGRFDRIIGP